MSDQLSPDSKVVVSSNQLHCDVNNETAILDCDRGVYYGLNEVASFIWKRVQRQATVREIRDAILAEYEVDSEKCERDLLLMLSTLRAASLIEIVE